MIRHILSLMAKTRQWGRIALAMRRMRRASPAELEQAQQALAALLADSRGLAMKMGQIMAGSADNNAFQALVTSIKPLPLIAIQSHLSPALTRALQTIDEAVAAASLGQVHHAVLNDGTELAIKIRYPGITDAIKAELKLSRCLPDAGPVKRWRFDSADYKATLHRQLLRETDYRIEMQTQQRFKAKLNVPGLQIPQVFPDYCSDAVLVQTWETGSRFVAACAWPKRQRLEIGRTLLMTLWQSLFVHGEVHGDPHPGNYLFRHNAKDEAETVLLDFGCTVLIGKQRRLALLKLIDACQAGMEADAFGCFVAMGFDAEKLTHLDGQWSALCAILFRPFVWQRPFHPEQWRLSADLQDLLGEQRWWFRAAGPADLMLLLRAFHGLSQQLAQLDIALPWWPLLQHVVGADLLTEARASVLPTVAVRPKNTTAKASARRLCVRVCENGAAIVAMDLPAEAATDLAGLMPASVLTQIEASGAVDLAAIALRLQHGGITPQALFDLDDGHRQCRGWLE